MRTLAHALSAAIAVVCTFVPALPAQFSPDPERIGGAVLPTHYPDRLHVKIREGTDALLRDGVLVSRAGFDLSAVGALFGQADRAEHAISVARDVLDRWHREADERLPEGAVRPGHLGLWFRLEVADPERAERLIEALRRNPQVQEADYVPIPYPAWTRRIPAAAPAPDDIPPETPDFSGRQTYKGPPPVGVDNDFADAILGGRGRGMRFIHVEADWVWQHEDLDALTLDSFIGPPTNGSTTIASHGTAVAGVVVAGRNGYGVTGMADLVEMKLVGWNGYIDLASAIAAAAENADPGDVIGMISMFQLFQTHPEDWVPAEYFQILFDAIRTATAVKRVLFLEAAGNGDNDLDDPRFGRRFDLSFRDSGAMFVAATDGSAPRKIDFSNFGSRIDTNGWGGDITSTGYGSDFRPNLDRRQFYTFGYAGTSGATALLSGTVTSLASVVRYQNERDLTPLELRALLRAHGTRCTGSIGKRPDLRAMLAAVGLPDGLVADRHAVPLGTSVSVTMSGPDGAPFVLIAGVDLEKTDLGLNRKVHIEPAGVVTVGNFVLSGGEASYSITVPNDPALRGFDVVFQGIRNDGGTIHVTSSAAIWLR